MMNYTYNVNAHFEKAETTLRTNDVNVAIQEFFDYVADGVHCDIVNGFTGEVLAIACSPEGEDYATDEMALMFLGFMMAEAWGEDEEVPTCKMCGGDLDEQGVCEYCGVVDGSAVVPADGVVADPIIAMLDDLVAMGKAVKLGGLPS